MLAGWLTGRQAGGQAHRRAGEVADAAPSRAPPRRRPQLRLRHGAPRRRCAPTLTGSLQDQPPMRTAWREANMSLRVGSGTGRGPRAACIVRAAAGAPCAACAPVLRLAAFRDAYVVYEDTPAISPSRTRPWSRRGGVERSCDTCHRPAAGVDALMCTWINLSVFCQTFWLWSILEARSLLPRGCSRAISLLGRRWMRGARCYELLIAVHGFLE